MALSQELSDKLTSALVKQRVRSKLNDVLSELKREFGGSLSKDELYQLGHYTLQNVMVACDEFVTDMKGRLARDHQAIIIEKARYNDGPKDVPAGE
ncbi:MAG TPA: hypothetical protein VI953_03490 [Candidatus Paceibacterota bacterium]